MSRTLIIVITLLTLMVLAGVGAVVGYLVVYPEYQARKVLEIANQDYAAARWEGAQRRYAWYLSRHPEALDVLDRYIECNKKVPVNRPRYMLNAARAYITKSRQAPSERHRDEAVGFLHRYGFWGELETLLGLYIKPGVVNPVLDYYLAVAVDRQGRLSEAEERYAALVPHYPELVAADLKPRDIFGGRARLLHQRGIKANARKVFEDAEAQFGEDPQFHVQRASYELLDGNAAAAEEAMRRAMALADNRSLGYEALITATRIAVEIKDFDRAVELATTAIDLDPKRPEAYLNAAYAHLKKVDYAEAISLLSGLDKDILSLYYQLYLLLAELQLETNDLEGAMATAKEFSAAFPDGSVYYDYLQARGKILEEEYAAAQEMLTNVINANPTFASARMYLFLSYLGQFVQTEDPGYWRAARVALDLYLNNQPGDANVRGIRQRLFEGDEMEGMKLARYLLAMQRAKADEIVSKAMGLLYGQSSGQDLNEHASSDIKDMLLRAINENPKNPSPYNILAQTYIEQNELEKARSVVEDGKKSSGRDTGFELAEAAIALAEKGLDQALQLRERAFADAEFSPASALPWAYLFARQGHLESALATLDRAAEATEGEDRASLLTDKVTLVLQYGTLEQARELVAALVPQFESYPTAGQRLAEGQVALAERFMRREENGDLETSQALLDAVDAAYPGRPDVKLLRTRIALRGDPSSTEAARGTAQSLLDQNGPELTDRVKLMCRSILFDVAKLSGDLKGALGHIKEASALFPNDPGIRLTLGRTQLACAHLEKDDELKKAMFNEACDQIRRVTEAEPENVEALETLVQAYTESGQLAAAESELARLRILLQGDDSLQARLNDLEGWIRARRGDVVEAEKLLRQSYQETPEDFDILEELARTIFAQRSQVGADRAEEALELVRQFMSRHPERVEGWTLLGGMHLQRAAEGDLDRRKRDLMDAVWAFSRAFAVDDTFEDAILGLVSTNLALGDTGKAEELLSRILAIEGAESAKNPKVHFLMAALLRSDARRYDKAMSHISEAIRLRQEMGVPAEAEFIALRGDLHLRLGNLEEAMRDMRELADKRGIANSAMYANMAEIYAERGDYEKAQVYYDSARARARADETFVLERLERVKKKLEEHATGAAPGV